MKKIFVLMITIIMILLESSTAFATPCGMNTISTDKKDVCSWNIRIRPLYAFLSGASVIVDYQLDPHLSIGPDLTYYKHKLYFDKNDDSLKKRFVIGVNTVYYVSDRGFSDSGLTLTGNLSYGKHYINDSENPIIELERVSDTFAVEFLGGYHWRLSTGFNFDLGIGIKYLVEGASRTPYRESDDFTVGFISRSITPTVESSVGYSF